MSTPTNPSATLVTRYEARDGFFSRLLTALAQSRTREAQRRIVMYVDGVSDVRLCDMGFSGADIRAIRSRHSHRQHPRPAKSLITPWGLIPNWRTTMEMHTAKSLLDVHGIQSYSAHRNRSGFASWLGTMVRALAQEMVMRRRMRRDLHALLRMDDRMLCDIGIGRSED